MSETREHDRVVVTAGGGRLGVSILIGDVVVTVAGPASSGVLDQSQEQVRAAALRLAARALEVAQQEIAQEQG